VDPLQRWQQTQARPGIQVYRPGAAPLPAPATPPARRAPQAAPTAGGIHSKRVLATQVAQQDDEEEEGNPFGRGLGFLINNPLTRGVLKPLEMLDYGRRAVTLGLEEFAEGITGQELEATKGDTRSNMDKLKDPAYGVGQLLGGTLGDITPWEGDDQWIDRIGGFIGDVALDPLTYLSAGTASVAGKANRAASLAKLSQAQKAAAKAGDAARVAELGGREALERIGQRGLGTASKAQNEAMGLAEQGLRFGLSPTNSVRIPGTAPLARGVNEAVGALRPVARSVPGAKALRRTRDPKGFLDNDLGPAYERIITGKGPGTIEGALESVALDNYAREIGRGFGSVAKDELEVVAKQVKDLPQIEISDMVRRAEELGESNIWTQTADRMREVAEFFGAELPQLEGGRYAMPHILSREFRNYIVDNANDSAVIGFRRASGITETDLLEESGFLQRRAFRLGPDRQPTVIPIGDKEITLRTGSVDELNRVLKEAFPAFDGEIYEVNPITAYRRYIDGVSRDVAKRGAHSRAADEGFSNVFRTGPVPESFDPYSGRVDVFPEAGGVGQRATKIEGDFQANEFYEPQVNDRATKARNKAIVKNDKPLIQQYRDAAADERQNIASQMEELAQELLDPARAARRTASDAREAATKRMAEAQRTGVGAQAAADEARAVIDDISAEIDTLANARYNIERSAKSRTKRQQKKLLDDLNARRLELIAERNRIRSNYRSMMDRVDESAARAADRVMGEAKEAQSEVLIRERKAASEVRRAEEAARQRWKNRTGKNPPTNAEAQKAMTFLETNKAKVKRYVELIEESKVVAKKIDAETMSDVRHGYREITADMRRLERINTQLTENFKDIRRAFATIEEHRQFRELLDTPSAGGVARGAATSARREADDLRLARQAQASIPARNEIDHPLVQGAQRQAEEVARSGEKIKGRLANTQAVEELATDTELADTASRFGAIASGQDDEFNAIAARNADQAAQRIDTEITPQRAALQAKQVEYEELIEEMDAVTGDSRAAYLEAMSDEATMRAEHERIAAPLEGWGVSDKGGKPSRIVEGQRGGRPSKPALDKVAAGEIPPAVAQPLYNTVEDLRVLLREYPEGIDDELVRRVAASLWANERALSKLTTELDIPAREVEAIVKAAKDGTLAPVLMARLRDQWRLVWDDGDVVISRELDRVYRNLEEIAQNPKVFGRVLEQFTNFFKTYATLTPGFHVRNGMSATFMNFADGVAARHQLRGISLWSQYARSDEPLKFLKNLAKTDPQAADAFKAAFASGTGGRFLESGFADATRVSGKVKERIFDNHVTRLSQRVGQDWVEGPVRLGAALDTLANGGDVGSALQRITRLQFDYSQVSRFDEKAKRLIPFWTFMSRNLPLQITQMWTRPRLYAQYNSFVRNMTGEPEPGTPEYFEKIGAFRFGDAKLAGLPLFLQPDFAHTRLEEDAEKIEDVLSGRNIGRALTDFNPIFTAPVEYITDRDLYTGREYSELDMVPAEGIINTPLGQIARLLGLTEEAASGKTMVPEKFLALANSINPLTDRTSRVLPQLATGDVGSYEGRQVESIGRLFGAPIRQLSPRQQQSALKGQRFDQQDELALQRFLAQN
jgi:hypothetical protein